MRSVIRFGLSALAAAAISVGFAGAAFASSPARHASHRAGTSVLFVQNDALTGNQVIAYARASDGGLSYLATYDTGGLGGQLTGSVVDHVASQGSLVFDRATQDLYAVNAGSNTVSVFAVDGATLALRDVVRSGGTFPVSIATRGHLVYVVNALNGGDVQGFVGLGGRLFPIAGSRRALDLNPSATPQFVNTPGQIAFTPDGRQLIVTTKANGNDIDVFSVRRSGDLSATPTVNSEPGAVPFAVSFDGAGRLVVTEAGTNSVATFTLGTDGTVTPVSTLATGQSATCWISRDRDLYYASNAGSPSLTGVREGANGSLTDLGNTTTDAGTVDSAVSPDGHFLYVQAGGPGAVDAFSVAWDGALTEIGSVTVPNAVGGEGIVAL